MQYFLRPLLKEYEFEPATRALTVSAVSVSDASATTSLRAPFAATRIAYSVFGRVLSLTGEPERGVVVEATQQLAADAPQGTARRYEHTKTDAAGAYRLRGLFPNLTYRVSVKADKSVAAAAGAAAAGKPDATAEAEVKIERAAPEFVAVRPSVSVVSRLSSRLSVGWWV